MQKNQYPIFYPQYDLQMIQQQDISMYLSNPQHSQLIQQQPITCNFWFSKKIEICSLEIYLAAYEDNRINGKRSNWKIYLLVNLLICSFPFCGKN
jgi:hypothetical protein